MTWMTSTSQNTFASLGVRHGDSFNVSEDCLNILEEILRKLALEDQTLRTFRRAIGFGQNIKKDLIPLLIYVKDDTQITDASKIIDATIKILVNLTIPVECLLSIEAVSRTDVGRHTIFELNRLLITSKEAFADSRSTKAVMDHIKHVVERDSQLNMQQCDSINNCLLLLRNILHIPEHRTQISNCPLAHSSMQNEIIWNLFTQSIDKIIIYLVSCPQKMYWGVTMVQLIALMYKDQHVGTLQKLLNLWLEASLSESSEDNESNTSPPNQGSGESSPIITSDPTSDSSDNGGGSRAKSCDRNKNSNTVECMRNKNNTTEVVKAVQSRSKALVGMKRGKSTETDASISSGLSSLTQSTESSCSNPNKAPQSSTSSPDQSGANTTNAKQKCSSSQSEVSDCGYVTQVENQESISTSSNDDDQPSQKPIHQKPHTFQKSRYNAQKTRATTALEKKELRRKKLVKRSKTNIINMKGLMHHTPTDEDISNILKEFTVDFLLKGYGNLVQDLHSQLLSNIQLQIDTSHFFWLVTYFLKFATQLELDLEHISPVLSYEIISYLTFQGVWLFEELEISCKIPDIDLKPCLRRLHLVVTAIREFLQAVETYLKLVHVSDEDKLTLMRLQKQISLTEDLKCLFLLLLRQYNPNIQSKQYLQDLIVTNHIFLLFLDNVSKFDSVQSANIMEHLKQFATVDIMRQYGLLLENFKENGEFVNNCVFTMMHHIGGDLEHVSTLFQPSILKTFSQIWETDYEICDDWSDLIEYVIHKFINTPRTGNCSRIASPTSMDLNEKEDEISASIVSSRSTENVWTQEEKENLLTFYNQSRYEPDTIANITKKYEQNGNKIKSQQAIIKELLGQNIINQTQYDNFMKAHHMECTDIEDVNKSARENLKHASLADGDIKVLKDYLYKENKGKFTLWLQKVVIEACFVKLALANGYARDSRTIMEPTVYYHALLNLPIPLVLWTREHQDILKHQPFVLLLHKLGFYLPADTGKIFVRIPNFWTADYLLNIALQLGPVDFEGISGIEARREMCDVVPPSCEQRKFSMAESKQTPSLIRYTPLPNSTEWVQNILKTKVTPIMNTVLGIPSTTSELSITIPVLESTCCNLPPPELAIVRTADQFTIDAAMQESGCVIQDDIERNSTYETASVASDLTRMCVSDEEDKLEFIQESEDENSL
ncbi:Timeless PAB domain [Popillia japonica]|uniref:Timeless PAB domain n=1 Tax=Popillia japonica TaxID=7064 RepID=A0AAW1N891_POPJA